MNFLENGVRRHARYGPTDRYLSPPAAGVCLSVFALAQERSRVLVGTPKPHERWTSEWLFAWLHYSKDELGEALRGRMLPSTYLWEGEDPKDALDRVMREQLRVRKYRVATPLILSYYSPSDWYPGNNHWDLAIVYPVKIQQPLRRQPWWRELEFVQKSRLHAKEFGWNADFVRDLGIVK